jgi:hypothetical protein
MLRYPRVPTYLTNVKPAARIRTHTRIHLQGHFRRLLSPAPGPNALFWPAGFRASNQTIRCAGVGPVFARTRTGRRVSARGRFCNSIRLLRSFGCTVLPPAGRHRHLFPPAPRPASHYSTTAGPSPRRKSAVFGHLSRRWGRAISCMLRSRLCAASVPGVHAPSRGRGGGVLCERFCDPPVYFA